MKKILLSLSLITLGFTSVRAQSLFAEDPNDLVKEDVLTDAQIDGFKPKPGSLWLGPQWWANRLADWKNGATPGSFICDPNRAFQPWRAAADMIHNIDLSKGELDISADVKMFAKGGKTNQLADDALVGFMVGSGHNIKNPKARAMIFGQAPSKNSPFPATSGSGYALGLSGAGKLRIIDLDHGKILAEKLFFEDVTAAHLNVVTKTKGENVTLTLTATKEKETKSISATVAKNRLQGGICLVSHPGTKGKRKGKKKKSVKTTALIEVLPNKSPNKDKVLELSPAVIELARKQLQKRIEKYNGKVEKADLNNRLKIKILTVTAKEAKKLIQRITTPTKFSINAVHPFIHQQGNEREAQIQAKAVYEKKKLIPGFRAYAEYEKNAEGTYVKDKNGELIPLRYYLVKRTPELTGRDIELAQASIINPGQTDVTLTKEGGEKMMRYTKNLEFGDLIVSLIDGKINSAASLNAEFLSRHFMITGQEDLKESKELAEALNNPLENELRIIEIKSGANKNAPISTAVSHFSNYKVKSGVERINAQAIGPIAMVQYTVSNKTLKLSAQCMPNAGKKATLSFYHIDSWKKAATVEVSQINEQALFRIENWDSKKPLLYRVSIPIDGSEKPAVYTGWIKAEPTSGKVRVAALGCIIHRPWGNPRNWKEQLYFPHDEIVDRVLEQKPDLVFFYGDQMYEGTPSYVDAKNIHEDYLYKWLFHCIAFNETTRNQPTVTIPDDHDVYQGNFWAAGGIKAKNGNWNFGGYKFPAAFIQQVHQTQTAHLPDCPAPHSMAQNIPAYFTDLNWGGVSFAVIGDRLFKSGPAGQGLPESKTNRPDHYNNAKFDTATLDLPKLSLLGKPQEEFLAKWAQDWSGNKKMKAVLSQSPFGNLATHHSGQYLIADLDSNGWPQSGRKRALRTMRLARAVHIAGDQHLSTLVQHGIENYDDGPFGFTAPAVANAYARAYFPGHEGNYYKVNPPKPEQYLGKRLDGFKNKVTFHAVANPDIRKDGPYHLDHQSNLGYQVPGFGIVDFDTNERTITFHSYPRSAEIGKRLPTGEYPGWPKTVKAEDNDGRKVIGYLANIQIISAINPIVKVYAPDGSLQFVKKYPKGATIKIPAFVKGEHQVRVSDGDAYLGFKASPQENPKLRQEALMIQ